MLKPEKDSHIDRRQVESAFFKDLEKHKALQAARDVKAIRLNRRQMSKNVPLADSYEPVLTTKQVESPYVNPEIDLPALRQSFKTTLGRNKQLDRNLNVITHEKSPIYQSFLS